jgi:RNA polymerase sigma-70 factor (ECF subfamily)
VALLVILQRLSPAERLAFVLHDMFDLPFSEIASIVGRAENTAAQLASSGSDDALLEVDAKAAVAPRLIRGAAAVAANPRMFSANARFAEPALIDGAVGVVVAPQGRLALVLRFDTNGERISQLSIEADPTELHLADLALLD